MDLDDDMDPDDMDALADGLEEVAEQTAELMDEFEEYLAGRAILAWSRGDPIITLGIDDAMAIRMKQEQIMKLIFRCSGLVSYHEIAMSEFRFADIVRESFQHADEARRFLSWMNGE